MDKMREAATEILSWSAPEKTDDAIRFHMLAQTVARAALAALPSCEGWRGMSEAPKDGTHVLVAFGPYDQWTTFAQKPATVAHWFGPPDLPGLRAGGWYLSVQQNEGPRIHPTHWRPLPSPPERK